MMFSAGSRLLLLPIQDIFGWTDRINLPATQTDANWTWTLPWTIERLAIEPDAMERAKRLAEWSATSGRTAVPTR
jgi:4-alpha-glucanotransferase